MRLWVFKFKLLNLLTYCFIYFVFPVIISRHLCEAETNIKLVISPMAILMVPTHSTAYCLLT